MLRRSKLDIYGDNSKTNIIIEKVDYDEKSVKSSEELAKQLAITALTGSFTEQGQAARALDLKLRQATGIAKAKNVALFVRMLVESGEKVILSAWHRDVYEIWEKELSDLGLVMYTGTENPIQKEKSKNDFINGNANIIVISHKSGAGLDGLQHVCSTVVLGELAWSHELHNQIIGRADRDGKINPVTAFIMISDYGSDPIMMDLLGLKYNQQKGILNPDNKIEKVNNDKSRMKELARMYLKNKNIIVEEIQ
jgi:SNF2 family DNA or RNA helicase